MTDSDDFFLGWLLKQNREDRGKIGENSKELKVVKTRSITAERLSKKKITN